MKHLLLPLIDLFCSVDVLLIWNTQFIGKLSINVGTNPDIIKHSWIITKYYLWYVILYIADVILPPVSRMSPAFIRYYCVIIFICCKDPNSLKHGVIFPFWNFSLIWIYFIHISSSLIWTSYISLRIRIISYFFGHKCLISNYFNLTIFDFHTWF